MGYSNDVRTANLGMSIFRYIYARTGVGGLTKNRSLENSGEKLAEW